MSACSIASTSAGANSGGKEVIGSPSLAGPFKSTTWPRGESASSLRCTTSRVERERKIMRHLGERGVPAAGFLFKAVDSNCLASPASQLFSEEWQRAGLPALRLDE